MIPPPHPRLCCSISICAPPRTLVPSLYLSLSGRFFVLFFMYVCMYVCTCVCLYVCTCACMYVCMYACMYVCMYVCTYVCIYVSTHEYIVHTDTRVRLFMYVSAYVCMFISDILPATQITNLNHAYYPPSLQSLSSPPPFISVLLLHDSCYFTSTPAPVL